MKGQKLKVAGLSFSAIFITDDSKGSRKGLT